MAKGTKANGNGNGKAAAPKEDKSKGKGPERVQTIEEQGIDPRTPYPTGGAAAAPAEPVAEEPPAEEGAE